VLSIVLTMRHAVNQCSLFSTAYAVVWCYPLRQCRLERLAATRGTALRLARSSLRNLMGGSNQRDHRVATPRRDSRDHTYINRLHCILQPSARPLPQLHSRPPPTLPPQPQQLKRRTARIKIQPLHLSRLPLQTHIIEPRDRQPMSSILISHTPLRARRLVVPGVYETPLFPAHEDVFFIQFPQSRFG